MKRKFVAFGLAAVLAVSASPAALLAQQNNGLLAGTAAKEAEKPFNENTVRALILTDGPLKGTYVGPVNLDDEGKFSLPNLQFLEYTVELLDKNGKLECSEGPFNVTSNEPSKDDIEIDCGHPAAWWLLAAAGAAGITAGVVAGQGSPSE